LLSSSLAYDELRRLTAANLAHEKPERTPQATALVHKAYLRLADGEKVRHWASRRHFFGAAAKAMGRILVDRVREEHGCKRGGEPDPVDFRQAEAVTTSPLDAPLALDEPRFFPMFGYQPGPRSD
jgi:hypothetical protein